MARPGPWCGATLTTWCGLVQVKHMGLFQYLGLYATQSIQKDDVIEIYTGEGYREATRNKNHGDDVGNYSINFVAETITGTWVELTPDAAEKGSLAR
jgi:hypothetical protein